MKRTITLLVLLCSAMLSGGCANPLTRPAQTFLRSVAQEYIDYVSEDADLSEDEKRIRYLHVSTFSAAVTEANK